MLKQCSSCNANHEIDFFYKKSNRCKSCVRLAVKEYRKNNPEKVKIWKKTECAKRAYIAAIDNPELREKRNKYMRKWYEKNKQKWKDSVKSWRDRNPEKRAILRKRYKARVRGAAGYFDINDIMNLMKIQLGKCVYCSVDISKKYDVDHIMPVSRGGGNNPENLQLTCRSCNAKKKDMLPDLFIEKLRSAA